MIQEYVMLDTNTVSHIVKGQSPAARTKLAELEGNQIPCISVITEAEIRFGLTKIELAKNPRAPLLRSSLEGFLRKIQVLEWGREEAIAYGELRARQEAVGKTLGNLDMLIAAHAIAVRAILVTADEALSQAAKGLTSVNWATDLKK